MLTLSFEHRINFCARLALELFELVFIVVAGVLGSAALCITFFLIDARAQKVQPPVPQDLLAEPRSFVFRDGYLISHSGGAGFLLPLP